MSFGDIDQNMNSQPAIQHQRNINHFAEGPNCLTSNEVERFIYSPTLSRLGLENA